MGRQGRDDERSDAELLVACGEEPEAFAAFYRRHVGALLGYLHARTGRAELAADVCAETFARALERHAQFDAARGPARGWLFMIGSGVLIDSFRRGQVEDRARRRLGIPPRELTDRDLDFLDGLERDLADAARRRAAVWGGFGDDVARIAARRQGRGAPREHRLDRGEMGEMSVRRLLLLGGAVNVRGRSTRGWTPSRCTASVTPAPTTTNWRD